MPNKEEKLEVKVIKDSVLGFALFSDIEDKALQARNRAVVLANIIEDTSNKKTGSITPEGAMKTLAYFTKIPLEERSLVEELLTEQLQQRGFVRRKVS